MSVLLAKIKNLISWIPTIWNDQDCDPAYVYMILRKKIANMKDYYNKYNMHESKERNIQEMIDTITILDRLSSYEYLHDEIERISPELFYTTTESNDMMTTLKFFWNCEEDEKLYHQLTNTARAMRESDESNLYYMLKTYLETWWT